MKAHSFGPKIKDLREAAGLTQEELAGEAGIATRQLQRIESGLANPKIGTLQALATKLSCDVIDFLRPQAGLSEAQSGASIPAEFPFDAAELAKILHALLTVGEERRLLALYFLTQDEGYYEKAIAMPTAARLARVLKKVL